MTVEPHYAFVGNDFVVTYQPGDTNGPTLLARGHLRLPGHTIELDFSASPDAQQTAIGMLLTVTLESSPDFGTRTVTLLVPQVNIETFRSDSPGAALGDTSWVAFDTQLIHTWHPETIAGPPHGAMQQYFFVPLAGAAHLLDTFPCEEWSAVYGSEPPDRPVLHVTGECRFPRAGFEATLSPHVTQPAAGGRLLLDLLVTEPTRPTAEVETVVSVQFREAVPWQPRTVVILPYGQEVEVGILG